MAAYYTHDIYQVRGDTMRSQRFMMVVNGATLSLAGVDIAASFKSLTRPYEIKQTLTIGNGIQVIDNDGLFEMGGVIMDIPAGQYLYDIQFDMPDGTRESFIRGNATFANDATL